MLELENLDDTSYSELIARSVSEIPRLCSEWTDFNAHDPGVTFLEMLMWLTEMQRYYLSQITEDHLESYLQLLGTTAKAAEPAVILARFFSEETASINKETVFYIGNIPYRPIGDMVIAPDKPEIVFSENGCILIKQDLTPFKGDIFPLYYSRADENNTNPIIDGFYSQAEIRIFLVGHNGETECRIKDGTYGLYQSGFINIQLPDEFDEGAAALRLEIVPNDRNALPECFFSDIRQLVQLDSGGNTLGADGTVKENIAFSFDAGGKKIDAAVHKEISSGKNAETPQDAFKRFTSEQSRMPRAVSKEDYARIVMETPGLRAEFVNVFSKETGKVTVCVKTADGHLHDSEIKNLRKVLFEAKPVNTEIEILTPIIYSSGLFISAKINGWAGQRKLTEHIKSVFAPLEEKMGAFINMPEILTQIGSSPVVTEIKGICLRLGKGIELTESNTLKLPEDGLLSLDEIVIQ